MDQDLMRETSLLVDYLSVTICMMRKMPLWFAGLLKTEEWGRYLSIQNHNKNLPRMLGYSYGQHTNQSQFGQVSSTFGMDNVQCTGNETSLLDCPHLTVDDCGSYEGAGVICSNTGMLQALRRNDRTAFLGDIIVHIFLINLQWWQIGFFVYFSWHFYDCFLWRFWL